mgnify:CR=1 FL=1
MMRQPGAGVQALRPLRGRADPGRTPLAAFRARALQPQALGPRRPRLRLAPSGWLRQALTVLNPREQLIVRKRRLEEDTSTLEELGETLGISKERVRQIESRAMEKLKSSLIAINPSMAGVSQ